MSVRAIEKSRVRNTVLWLQVKVMTFYSEQEHLITAACSVPASTSA